MTRVTAQQVRALILTRLQPSIAAAGLKPEQIHDGLDLLTEGLIDSLGIVELIGAIEQTFGVTIDFADLDPDQLTIIGPFCRYVEAKSNGAGNHNAANAK